MSLSDVEGTAQQLVGAIPGPPTEFTKFDKLPVEMCLKVWEMYLQDGPPRLIELEYDPDPHHDNNDSAAFQDPLAHRYRRVPLDAHRYHRVAHRSRTPPAILWVNREARMEALKYYQLCLFDTPNARGLQKPVYFNSDADIVYFGDATCISTIIRFSQYIARCYPPVPRVAIRCTPEVTDICCDWGVWDIDAVLRGKAVLGGCDVMQAFHGIRPSFRRRDLAKATRKTIPGYDDLAEVFWVLPSNLWKRGHGEIDAGVGFRPAVGMGMTKDQIQYKKDRMAQIEEAESVGGLAKVGKDKWIGDDLPTFQFVSLCPAPVGASDKFHDSMMLGFSEANKLSRNSWVFLNELIKSTGCNIDVSERGEHLVQEAGFYGTKKQIEKAKSAIEERIKLA